MIKAITEGIHYQSDALWGVYVYVDERNITLVRGGALESDDIDDGFVGDPDTDVALPSSLTLVSTSALLAEQARVKELEAHSAEKFVAEVNDRTRTFAIDELGVWSEELVSQFEAVAAEWGIEGA